MEFRIILLYFMAGIFLQGFLFLRPKFQTNELPRLLLVLLCGAIILLPGLLGKSEFFVGEGLLTLASGFILFFCLLFKDKIFPSFDTKTFFVSILLLWYLVYLQGIENVFLLAFLLFLTIVSAISLLRNKQTKQELFLRYSCFLLISVLIGFGTLPTGFIKTIGGTDPSILKPLQFFFSGMIFLRVGALIISLIASLGGLLSQRVQNTTEKNPLFASKIALPIEENAYTTYRGFLILFLGISGAIVLNGYFALIDPYLLVSLVFVLATEKNDFHRRTIKKTTASKA